MPDDNQEIRKILVFGRYRLSNGREVGSVTTRQLKEYYDHLETSLGGCVESELFVTNLSDIEAQLNLCWQVLQDQAGKKL